MMPYPTGRTLLEELLIGKKLWDGEILALYGAANGETSQATAKRVHLATETIKGYRKSATAKLGAKNLTHAVVIAIATGVLSIDRIVTVEDE